MQPIINILIMVVILGVLISLHEAGHLGMAKLFKVYCFEYSIGFGPKILNIKKEGRETVFSLRAFPIGGFVSMYGEEGAVPEGVEEPPMERSLENKKLYQKLLIMSAGVIVNYILGLILIFIAVSAFPNYYQGYGYIYKSDNGQVVSSAYVAAEAKEDGMVSSYFASTPELEGKNPNDYVMYLGAAYQPNESSPLYRVFDGDVLVTIGERETHYAALFSPSSLTTSRDLLKDIALYPLKVDNGALVENSDALKDVGVPYAIELYEDRSLSLDNLKNGEAKMELDIIMLPKSEGTNGIKSDDFLSSWDTRLVVSIKDIANKDKAWEEIGYMIPV
ncbi:MAG: site-2 protease family protein, partial [Bacilli bacterium]|nr:site-2 protease family protein [Bacilli bacterium]